MKTYRAYLVLAAMTIDLGLLPDDNVLDHAIRQARIAGAREGDTVRVTDYNWKITGFHIITRADLAAIPAIIAN